MEVTTSSAKTQHWPKEVLQGERLRMGNVRTLLLSMISSSVLVFFFFFYQKLNSRGSCEPFKIQFCTDSDMSRSVL